MRCLLPDGNSSNSQRFDCLQHIEVQKSSEIALRVMSIEQRSCICSRKRTCRVVPIVQLSNVVYVLVEKPPWRALPRYAESKSCWLIADALTWKFVHDTLCESLVLTRHNMPHELATRLLDIVLKHGVLKPTAA